MTHSYPLPKHRKHLGGMLSAVLGHIGPKQDLTVFIEGPAASEQGMALNDGEIQRF